MERPKEIESNGVPWDFSAEKRQRWQNDYSDSKDRRRIDHASMINVLRNFEDDKRMPGVRPTSRPQQIECC